MVKVHPEILNAQHLPTSLVTKDIWKDRYEDISNFERYLGRNGVAVRKFFLHVSKEEQRQRFLERLTIPEKNWKFSMADVKERNCWDDYQSAYEEVIRHTATPQAPWYVVPADHNGSRGSSSRRRDRCARGAGPRVSEGGRHQARGAEAGEERTGTRGGRGRRKRRSRAEESKSAEGTEFRGAQSTVPRAKSPVAGSLSL